MGLNKANGNMYEWVTSTWNTIKGECPHGCSYCYMHRWGKQKPVHFDKKELKTDLGSGNFIFVGSSCDMFADEIPFEWIEKTLEHCFEFDNKYLFQSKNPAEIWMNYKYLPPKSVICTTIETNNNFTEIMGGCPTPGNRATYMGMIADLGIKTFVTIEPIMDFDLIPMVNLIKECRPEQVNIGACSTPSEKLPEPSKEKLLALIDELKEFTTIANKRNLNRILNS